MITGQVKDLCYGLYGKTAVPIDPEVQKKALKGYDRGEEPITCRPAEVLEPELEKARQEIGDLAVDLDDLVVYALYPVTGRKFLQWKYGLEEPPASVMPITMDDVKAKDEVIKKAKAGELIEKKPGTPPRGEAMRTFNVFVDNEYFNVEVEPTGGAPVISLPAGGIPMAAPAVPVAQAAAPAAPAAAPAAPAAEPAAPAAAAPAPAAAVEGTPLKAPMPGMIVSYEKNVGDAVSEGETVLILEAMKMENALAAPCSGTVQAINYKSGDSVGKGDVLCVIG
jgi:oxaloacetate decarboxylase alpha subunit/pyruvate carboxylase subunit B